MNRALRDELLSMADEDRRVRAELAADGSLFDGYHPRMEEVHRRNATRLKEIIAAHDWLGRRLVGDDGAAAAWLVLQHAIGDPPLQRRGLALLWQAAATGDADPAHAAKLEDRVAVFEGRPQRYGTQFDWDEEGQLTLHPIADLECVDERRREVGLSPLVPPEAEAAPPGDLKERRRRAEAWARSVGWRAG